MPARTPPAPSRLSRLPHDRRRRTRRRPGWPGRPGRRPDPPPAASAFAFGIVGVAMTIATSPLGAELPPTGRAEVAGPETASDLAALGASWMWPSGQDRQGLDGRGGDGRGSTATALSRTFVVPDGVRRATLLAAGDFAGLTLDIGGKRLPELRPYEHWLERDVSRDLIPGETTLVVGCEPVAGPSAVAVVLAMELGDGSKWVLRSDADWRDDAGRPPELFGPVSAQRWGGGRLPDITPFAEYNQWKEALGHEDVSRGSGGGTRLSPLPDGFEIRRVHDAAADEGSWVSLSFDPRGRLVIGKEQRGLLRLTLDETGDRVLAAETVEDSLGECRGLVWRNGTLYAHANRDQTLARLPDVADRDRYEQAISVITTEGGPGHGRNALTVGPDGAIHGIVGDDIDAPDGAIRRARPEPDGPRELGHWFRLVEDDGKVTWEAMNRGLRNPYGIAFHPDGEAFTYDADNEGDVGLPFYRPTRINHLVSGANYGWHQARGNRRSLPVYAADSVPTTLDLGRGSPTAVRFGRRSHFPGRWRDALYVLDWAYGRIIAVHLTPHGASYAATAERFLEGRPLNVTDLDFDRDGAMWFVTGGRKTQSSLYRVRYVGTPPGADGEDAGASRTPRVATAAPATGETVSPEAPATTGVQATTGAPATTGVQAQARAEFSAQRRRLRHRLERFHGVSARAAVDEAWPVLGDPDPWLRNAARVALEWQPVERWRERVSSCGEDLGGLTAMLALARAGEDADRRRLAEQAAGLETDGLGITEQLTLVRVWQIAVPSLGDLPSQAWRDRAVAQWLAMAESGPEAIAREVATLLADAGATEAVDFALHRLATADDQGERLHYLEVLGGVGEGWTGPRRTRFFEELAYAKRFSAGDRFMPPFFGQIESSALSHLPDEESRARMSAMLAGPWAEESAPEKSREFVKSWTMDDWPAEDTAGLAGEAASRQPDRDRGKQLFVDALCVRCHVCGTIGRPVGPELTTAGRRFGRRDLLEAIIEPSKVIAEAYRNVVVLRHDGTTVTGRILRNDFRGSQLELVVDDGAASRIVAVPKGEIESWSESPVSPMPSGLLDSLTREEIDDLLGFILADGQTE